ncbi:MAG: hypothetical protein Q8N56_00225 [bacterium]|nr:hypothetical protein [bacterium]
MDEKILHSRTVKDDVLNPKIVRELLSIKGQCRNMAVYDNVEFILAHEGEAGLALVEKIIAEAECPFKTSDLKSSYFFPIGFETIMLLAMKKAFNYDDEKFEEIGVSNAKQSLIVRIFAKYFVSIRKVAEEAPKMWKRYYLLGDVKIIRFSEERKEVVVRVEGFKVHPLHCRVFKGYFGAVLKMIVGAPVKARETSCVFQGGAFDEFLLTW